MDRLKSAIILFGLAAGLAFSFEARDEGPPSPKPCLDCHQQVTLEGTVHAALSCADCHIGFIRREGSPAHQAKKDLPPPTCGVSCHEAQPDSGPGGGPGSYPDSVHGRAYLERGVPEVAKCWDCHGRHIIKPAADPESLVNRHHIPLTCSRCHDDMAVVLKYNIHAEAPYREYLKSVHGRPSGEGGVDFAAVCTDCHGAHDIQGVGVFPLKAARPETCGACHARALEEYSRSIHGREALKGNPDVPVCVDCHGEHAVAEAASPGSPTAKARIPDTCSGCHARPEIMSKYGVPEDRIATFIESYHGIAVGMGGTAEATCVDCHGIHDIRPAADPGSTVFPANLARTCGQASCHPDMSAKIAGTKIHRDYGRRGSGAPYYVRKALLWTVLILTALTFFYLLPSIIRRARGRKAR